jgi:hypothetical protein
MSNSSVQFYSGGPAIFDMATQTNLVPQRFVLVRDAAKAWHYKLSSIMLLVLLLALAYGGYQTYTLFNLRKIAATTQQQLALAKREEEKARAKAKAIYDRVQKLERAYALGFTKQPIANVLGEVAAALPPMFYVESWSLTVSQEATNEAGKVVQLNKGEFPAVFTTRLQAGGKLVGLGVEAVESKVAEGMKGVEGFKITQAQSLGSGEGLELGFSLNRTKSFNFSPAPPELKK